jgi:glycosyltransferase involved in cell wall biosynthesis
MQIKDLVLVAPITDVSGTAEVARNIYDALFDLGIKVKLIELPGWSHIKADLSADTRDKLDIGFNRNDVNDPAVIHFYPPNPYQGIVGIGGQHQVSYTVFETDKCPILWRDIFNNPPFVENWVACDFHVDAYSSQGVDKNKMKVIPFGVDSNRFRPGIEPLNIKGKEGFTIGTALDWSVRKNPQGMVTAFLQEFNNQPDATLIIKSYTGYGDAAAAEGIRQEIAKIRAMVRSNARILFIPDYLHADAMPAFHNSLDAWFNLSRGEGWDLGSLQSMACGVPVIGADNSSHKVYLNSENGYPVQCTKVPITSVEFLSKNANFIGHNWWEPDIKAARRQLRQAYTDWKDGSITVKKVAARQKALDLPWKNTAVKIITEIGKYYQ